MMVSAADTLVSKLRNAGASGKPVDVRHLLGRLTMEVVGITAFGSDPPLFYSEDIVLKNLSIYEIHFCKRLSKVLKNPDIILAQNDGD